MLTQEDLNSLDSLLDAKFAPVHKIYSILIEHGKILADHTNQLKEIHSTLDDHSKILADHTSQLKEIHSTLDNHSKILADHTSQLKEIHSTLDELEYSVEEIRTTVNVLAGWADKTSHKVRIPL